MLFHLYAVRRKRYSTENWKTFRIFAASYIYQVKTRNPRRIAQNPSRQWRPEPAHFPAQGGVYEDNDGQRMRSMRHTSAHDIASIT
ncbi:hypothetical protein IVW58_20690 [Salmonella enterica subsp. enterica serovar Worthington]|nr:hypothetical protein [Salmonella enterica subsp. enterica serovar Worthington]MBP1523433.1 hypothetical protein [Salmonella enterica subsp. enterica serovar Worthington]MBZ3655541.1 hypothetical protein [Salmonella enterica subsp. enterica serovar Senftenberg]